MWISYPIYSGTDLGLSPCKTFQYVDQPSSKYQFEDKDAVSPKRFQ